VRRTSGGAPLDCELSVSSSDEHRNSLALLTDWTLKLFEVLLGDDAPYECLNESNAPVWSHMLIYLFMVVISLLGLNMLIASMATTYERVRERLAINYMFITAINVSCWHHAPFVPAPLRVFALPYYAWRLLLNLSPALHQLWLKCFGWSPISDTNSKVESNTTDKVLSEKLPTIAKLRELSTKHLDDCAGDVAAEDERWRMRFLRLQNSMVLQQQLGVKTIMAKQEAVFAEVRRQEALRVEVHALSVQMEDLKRAVKELRDGVTG